ncbi:protein FRA10AC1 homolog isoform X2 [Phoenix dactylifera]|uniref:Protein FRA10AC1 homolog isoform X2 n=1 Tax=Phoenix dactylifera TaxID=42345 RepID=A0A8B8ZVN3_PHODC|nr:protein FRA10AC1 homolog isoform X2 [Phoenix dactylifera]
MASLGSLKSAVFHREERKMQYQSHIRGLNAYDRHKKFMNDYVQFYGNTKNVHNDMPIKTDQDTIREGYRFIISEDDDMDSTWEKRLVKRYYDKLFKEYCIADMSQYKMGKFICGNRACNEKESLGSYEVNFSYTEAGESKQALVKLVACKRCSEKLVYKRKKEKEHSPVREKEKYKRKRERSRDGDSTDDEYDKSTNRSRKGQKTSSSANDGRTDEDNFEEFLEGMFP